ncbi:hypothetical protein H5395_01320 [Paracoccus sp. MC1854]|uniref:glycosyltransferase n=1 Tax=Paracoccus sp. MC1854 TaxID=2760306 RepID=UPI0016003C57|nr:hypothetical protein [Paracoccus sp. MC1854]
MVCSDANWAWQSAFLLMRSMAFDAGKALDHHLYLAGDVDQRVLDILPPEITLHRIEELPESYSLAAKGHIPAASLLRLVALEELGRSYPRIIYLDGDVFQAWGSLADLLAVDLEGKLVAAVRDKLQWPSGKRWMERYINQLARRCGVDRLEYFNSGVLLIDGTAYVDAKISARTFAFITDNRDFLRFVDQCALNAVLATQWCELSPGWNWQVSRKVLGLTVGRRPRLVHFVGEIKPWVDQLRVLPPEAFHAMLDFLKHHRLTDLLSPKAPCHFDFRSMERTRVRFITDWAGDTFAKREAVKSYLDRTDFADYAAGLRSFG